MKVRTARVRGPLWDWDGYEHQRPAHRVGLTSPTADVRACACGGEIVVNRRTDGEITAAVESHRLEERHEAWAEATRDR